MRSFLKPLLLKMLNQKMFKKILVAAAALAAAWLASVAAAVTWYACSRRPYLREVHPELKHPGLYLPFHWLPEGLFVWASPWIAAIDATRAADSDITVSVVTGVSPDDGHPFTTRRLAPVRNSDSPRPAVLWTHGGGHLIGNAGFYDPQNGRVARELDAVVFAPDYRKAYHHPFPADLDDCYAVLRWMQVNAQELGIDPNRIAVAGDSAGGGLAAGVVQRAHDAGHPVAFQGLVYPMVDHQTTDKEGAAGQFIWSAASNRGAWARYLGHDHLERAAAGELPPYASPTHREDLSGMPPTWIGVGEIDLFFEEAVAFAHKLEAAGVDVELDTYPGAYHGFDHIKPNSPQAHRLLRDFIAALKKHL